MMLGIKYLVILLLISGNEIYSQSESGDVLFYKKFPRAGTVSAIRNYFNNRGQLNEYVDTTYNESIPLFKNEDFKNILKRAKRSRFIQPKIPGIVVAGEFIVNGEKHFFVICTYDNFPGIIVDLTGRKTYTITNYNDKNIISILLSNVGVG